MASFKFTARSLPPVPSSGQVDYWDELLPGFGMRVSLGGARTWVVMYRYNGVKRRLKLGTHPGTGLADARDAAREAIRKAEKGLDPATEKKALHSKSETVQDLATLYIELHAKVKKRSWFKDNQILNREVLPLIGRKKVADVTRQDVRDILQPIIERGATIKANHTLEVVRKMFNWSIETRDTPASNPAARLKKPGEVTGRSRYLAPAEIKAFWAALHAADLGERGIAAFKLMALTAQREMEVVRMRWSDLDLEDDLVWTIPGDHSKNRLEHVIPLTSSAAELLRLMRKARGKGDVYVFQSPAKADAHLTRNFIEDRMVKIRKHLTIEHFTPHDLRRTVTTYLGKLKVPQQIKKKILNHTKVRKTDVTDIYDRFEYLDEKRDALTKWEDLLLSMIAKPADGNVVSIARATA
ncbi:MAG: DUF4102 domain-containing protein [Rhodospirillaceae bacterium]|nr:MAG: DUF4102 domain-containing protein [Rhodospirillaceae bacterium]